MKKEKKNQEYHKPNIGKFIKFLCEEYQLDEADVLTKVTTMFPELKDKTTCANCGASMAEYLFTLDQFDALLLLGMGKIVGKRAKTMAFKDANKVHIQSQLNDYYSVASRTTQCAKLGLIAKVLHKDGVHDQKAGWLITRRGFEFLAGRRVPKYVTSFRNKIVERMDETTTIQEVMDTKSRNPAIRDELVTHQKYNFEGLETWAISGFTQGTLL